MISYDIDPSLHACEPVVQTLDDGFSPPRHEAANDPQMTPGAPRQLEPVLSEKSEF